MLKCIALFCLCSLSSILTAEEITGFWKRINHETGNTQCVISIYEYGGKHFGRIIGTFDPQGRMKENLYQPIDRAEKVAGSPFYCGMDLLLNLVQKESKFKGTIVDPRSGRFYDSSVWVKDGKLIIRGELLCFGKNEIWFPLEENDLPEDFKKPHVSSFIPVIPSE